MTRICLPKIKPNTDILLIYNHDNSKKNTLCFNIDHSESLNAISKHASKPEHISCNFGCPNITGTG